jgi:glycosyltransferase involved in cell wall biosynthesis
LLISPHFPPDSAAGTHRARILAPHLAKCGWNTTVLTVDAKSVEGELDEELAATVTDDLSVVRVAAWPAVWTRRAGFGDLGLRAYRPLRRAAASLASRQRIDAALITTYPTYPAMIGVALKKRFGIPFVLDLQDPWVGAWGKDVGPGGVPDLRSRASRAVAVKLEQRAAASADALMSVTTRTMTDVVSRVPEAGQIPKLEIPIGWEPSDWERVRRDDRRNGLFDPSDGHVHVCAVGTLLPTALDGLRSFLDAVAEVTRDADARRRLKVWFVGTSNERRSDAPAVVRPLALTAGVADVVTEHPARLAYFDALRVLRDASAVLVLGSGEPHYTPSRVFPALASRRPVLARLHPHSPAANLLCSAAATRPIHLVRWSPDRVEQSRALADGLRKALMYDSVCATSDVPLVPFTGESLARRVAALLDQVTSP